jgi:peptide deformylase
MAVLEIVKYPDPFLKQKAKDVLEITPEIHKLIDDMADTMYDEPGVGLAAPQVGRSQRIIVYDISAGEGEPGLEVFINPVIVEKEGSMLSENEGCLSVPDFRADVKRYARVRVEGLDREGYARTVEAEGFPAVVLQHEIDHLEGVLFIDRISALKRGLYAKRIRKMIKKQSA